MILGEIYSSPPFNLKCTLKLLKPLSKQSIILILWIYANSHAFLLRISYGENFHTGYLFPSPCVKSCTPQSSLCPFKQTIELNIIIENLMFLMSDASNKKIFTLFSYTKDFRSEVFANKIIKFSPRYSY